MLPFNKIRSDRKKLVQLMFHSRCHGASRRSDDGKILAEYSQ